MIRETKHPNLRFRGKKPRYQRQEKAGEDPSRSALRALVRLLARQAAGEVVDGSGTPPTH